MLWHLSGEDLTLRFDFMVDGALVVPDAASIQLTVRGHAGVPVSPFDPQDYPSVGTSLEVTIPGAANTLTAPDTFESRFVILNFRYNGAVQVRRHSYRVSEFLPISATPADVANLLGLVEDELPEADVDLYQAYYQILMGTPELATALTTTSVANLLANRAIALQAALLLAPGLPARFAQSTTSADREFTRFSNLKVAEIIEKLEEELDSALADMLTPGAVEVVAPTLFIIAARTDPVTGA